MNCTERLALLRRQTSIANSLILVHFIMDVDCKIIPSISDARVGAQYSNFVRNSGESFLRSFLYLPLVPFASIHDMWSNELLVSDSEQSSSSQ